MARELDLFGSWAPRGYQLPAWRYLQAGGRHAELIWHRRAGKDDLCLKWGARAAMTRQANYWHMLPEAAQARKAIWDAVNPHTGRKRIDEAFPHEIRATTREQEMQIVFKNGSTWQVVGSDNFNSLVGATPAGIVYSEWALANPAARAYLRPILAENKGWQLFITTPRGRNHAYRTFNAAKRDPAAFTQLLPATETEVFTAEQLAEELREYIGTYGKEQGEALYEQEYLVSFDAAVLGAVLGRWMSRARLAGRITDGGVFDPKGGPVYISSDLGFRDTASWWFWQPRADGFGLVDYMGQSGLDADDWIEKLKEQLTARGMRLGKIWLPHDARNKTFATKHSAMERFLQAFGAEHVAIVPQTKISDRINAARRVVDRCIFDEKACADGVSGLESWRYEFDPITKVMGKEPVHDWASHPGDAFSYGCQMLEELRVAPPPKRSAPRGIESMTAEELFWGSLQHQNADSNGL